jgi:hypothetical protein
MPLQYLDTGLGRSVSPIATSSSSSSQSRSTGGPPRAPRPSHAVISLSLASMTPLHTSSVHVSEAERAGPIVTHEPIICPIRVSHPLAAPTRVHCKQAEAPRVMRPQAVWTDILRQQRFQAIYCTSPFIIPNHLKRATRCQCQLVRPSLFNVNNSSASRNSRLAKRVSTKPFEPNQTFRRPCPNHGDGARSSTEGAIGRHESRT